MVPKPQRAALVVATSLLATLLGSCAAAPAPESQDLAPAAPGATSAGSPGATPTGATPLGPTHTGTTPTGGSADPRLDQVARGLIRPDQVPGWEQVHEAREPLSTVIEPAACQPLVDQVLGRGTGPRGATVTYRRAGVTVQQWIEYLEPGATPVADLQQLASTCRAFTMNDAGERTPATAYPLEAERLGDRRLAIHVVVRPAQPVHLGVMWVLQGDTLMTVLVDGTTTPEADLNHFSELGYANQRTLN
ncbi:hypothetical protein [Granulicoccus phenolivorans]|uniref:hypothetical protein n=1 Tax=Granulicoccus phenolivorans TaxID=266854 RepID=UPI000414C389|nr:hypothetical protein [Granulicoccus phenolivorans]